MKRSQTTAIVIHTVASNSKATYKQVMDLFLKIFRWQKGGYHYIYEQDGDEFMAYDPVKMEATNGILPGWVGNYYLHNGNTIHLSYIGGINDVNQNEAVCNITPQQEQKMIARIKELLKIYPNVGILGHNQINAKACPSFWTPDWLRAWDIPENNIWDLDRFKCQRQIKSFPHPPNFYQKRFQPIPPKVCPTCGKVL